MKQNNSKFGAIVGLFTVIITQIILRALGVNEFSTIIYVTVLALSGITFSYIMITSRNKKFGKKNSIVASILTQLTCISNIIAMIMIRCYPQFGDEHKVIAIFIILLAFVTFFALIIFWIVMAVKISK